MISRTHKEREREGEKKEHKGPKPISPQLHPTHQRERDATPPHMQTLVQGPPHSDEQCHLTRSTQPHLHPLWALHVLDPPRQNSPSRQQSPSHLQHLRSVIPMSLVKHFSQTHPLQYPIHIPSNPSPFSSLLSLNLTSVIMPLRSHPSTVEIAPLKSLPMTHPWLISLFLDLPVPFP